MATFPAIESSPSGYPVYPRGLPDEELAEGPYRLRFARTEEQLDRVLRLRYQVFNLELNEGLEESRLTGRDEDPFDAVCHHLIVDDRPSGKIVGTYRIQTAEMARQSRGFYSDDEFDLAALPADLVDRSVELGRACIAREHRNRQVLFLLWRGLARYLVHNQKRYLFVCCSLTSQNPAEGVATMEFLRENGQVHPSIFVPTRAICDCGDDPGGGITVNIPTLFKTYLRYGSKVIGGPAIDRRFKTIDYLVLLDVQSMSRRSWTTFFS